MSQEARPPKTTAIVHRPVQEVPRSREKSYVSDAIHMAAYEVYSHVYGPQRALIEGNCRGGFGVGELVAFLYARSFPKSEWRQRVDEAFRDNVNL